ncbi:caspase-1-like isoform X2 [Ixodes scapularis]|uniref:caspase-1-like isoform X2 n=1 Tax=Ixodes scapularis TaxID=6945 RepID=UPI001A9EE053|nr:caspase-1-like isoform X2 [Ixodes scapularis]
MPMNDQLESCSTKETTAANFRSSTDRRGAGLPPKTSLESPRPAYYNLSRQQRGRCIIFNVQKFSTSVNLTDRSGADVDAFRITNTFRKLGFKCQLVPNPTTRKVRETLQEVSIETKDDADCFVCFFLSHGKLGRIFSCDDELTFRQLIDPVMRSKSLRHKPKLFFIQACQEYDGTDYKDAPDGWSYSIPSYPDVFVGFSTPPGYYSWRNEQNGSHYINALCSVLYEEASSDKPRDFVSLMAVVNRQLGLRFESYTPSNYKTHRKKQTPCFVSTLTRKLVLASRDSAA